MALPRRRLLASAGAGGLAAAAGGGGFALGREAAPEAGPDDASQIVAFHGEHQAGIATPAQDRLHFAAFDIEEGLRARDLRDLLREWSRGAERMTAGQPVGEDDGGQLAPPTDTGEAMARHVWVAGDRSAEPAWLRGGTYLVARRIRMLIEVWDRAPLGDQEKTIGRQKTTGAPLGGREEFDTPDLARLPADSHIRLAAPSSN